MIENRLLTPATINELCHSPHEGWVLSVYLDTSPDRIRGKGYLLAFRDGCKALRPKLSSAQRASFKAAAERAERFLTEEFESRHNGIAVFTTDTPDFFFAIPLPAPPREAIVWDHEPHVLQLEEALDEYERIGVALFDKERARLFTIYLGEIEERLVIRDEVPGKQATGEWFGLAQTRFARHQEEHVMRHVKHTVQALMRELRSKPFDHFIIGGPDEATSMLRHQLPRPLKARLAGTISLELFASDAAVLKAVLATMNSVERHGELLEVQGLVEAAGMAKGALGPEATLGALAEGRVYRLLIANSFHDAGSQCQSCGRLVIGAGTCTSCGGRTASVADLGEAIVRTAIEQGAAIETVSGEAAEVLMAEGGLGAWVRYQ